MKFSFAAFFAIYPMPAARPVSVAASRTDITSLFLDLIVYIMLKFQSRSEVCGGALARVPGFVEGGP